MKEQFQSNPDMQRNMFCRLGNYIIWFYNSFPTPFVERIYTSSGYVHTHSGYEVHCPTQGSYYLTAGQERLLLQQGQLAVLAPQCYHNTEPDPKCQGDARCVSFNFSFPQKLSADHALFDMEHDDEQIVSAFSRVQGCAVVEHDEQCLAIIKEIQSQLLKRQPGFYQIVQGLLTILIVTIARKIPERAAARLPMQGATAVRKALIEDFFNQNVGYTVTSELLAETLHISVRQLGRVMEQIYGMGFKKKLMNVRVEVTKSWLCHTDEPLSKIAEVCGYSFESSLIHTFKKETGMTPMAYRKNQGHGRGQTNQTPKW